MKKKPAKTTKTGKNTIKNTTNPPRDIQKYEIKLTSDLDSAQQIDPLPNEPKTAIVDKIWNIPNIQIQVADLIILNDKRILAI